MEDLLLTRVYLDEYENLLTAKIGLPLTEIQYYEEYKGSALASFERPIVTVHLYSGEAVCIAIGFEMFKSHIDKFRREQDSFGVRMKNN